MRLGDQNRLRVEVEHVPYIAILTARGDTRAGSLREVQSAILELLEAGAHRIVLDLSGVTFLGASSVEALLSAAAEASLRTARVILVIPGISKSLSEVINSRFPTPWQVVESRDAAIEEFESGRRAQEVVRKARRRADLALAASLLALVLAVLIWLFR